MKKGLDLADYLLRFDINEFKLRETAPADHLETLQSPVEVNPHRMVEPTNQLSISKSTHTLNWDPYIAELESYFYSAQLPNAKVHLGQGTTIKSIPGFLQGHFATVKRYNGNPTFLPHLNRLIKLKDILQSGLYQ